MNDEVKAYLAEIGQRGGKAKSAAKSAAAKANGKLGGRPRSKATTIEQNATATAQEEL
jgi:hypothetical protein